MSKPWHTGPVPPIGDDVLLDTWRAYFAGVSDEQRWAYMDAYKAKRSGQVDPTALLDASDIILCFRRLGTHGRFKPSQLISTLQQAPL